MCCAPSTRRPKGSGCHGEGTSLPGKSRQSPLLSKVQLTRETQALRDCCTGLHRKISCGDYYGRKLRFVTACLCVQFVRTPGATWRWRVHDKYDVCLSRAPHTDTCRDQANLVTKSGLAPLTGRLRELGLIRAAVFEPLNGHIRSVAGGSATMAGTLNAWSCPVLQRRLPRCWPTAT